MKQYKWSYRALMVVEAPGEVVVVIVQRIIINATVDHVSIQTNKSRVTHRKQEECCR